MKIIVDDIFVSNLRKMRDARGLTQEETAIQMQLLGSPLERDGYANIETGRGNIFINDLVALRQVFKVDYAEFFKDVPPSRETRKRKKKSDSTDS